MREFLVDALLTAGWVLTAHVALFHLVTLLLVLAGARRVWRNRHWRGVEGHDETFASPLTPAVSILVPAHDEEAGILDTLSAALGQKYPALEVVLVDDGSTDRTFALVAARYALREVAPRPTADLPVDGEILSVHRATTGDPLLVLRKHSVGRRSDALNAALNHARHPLVCMVDADSLLETEALLQVSRPFVEDPDNVVAAGGVIRAANGALTDRGTMLEPRLSRRWVVRVQVIEYLRSFLLGRTGWADAQALLIISGAFGLFRRDVVLEVGGMDPNSLAEDAELVVTIQEHLRRRRRPHRVVFVPQTVCWTEVPESWQVLGRQRKRWSHGLGQLLWKHRRMIGNPRYGPIGVLALPFFLLFELLGPVVEIVGVAAVVTSMVLGLVEPAIAGAVLVLAIALGVLLSATAIAVEELTYHRYGRGRDLLGLMAAALVEHLWFRWAHSWYRLRGLVAALTRRSPVWTAMPRVGFSGHPASAGRPVPADVLVPAERLVPVGS
ncbi:glycosyltransferase family 2 protein [Blastococcus haudaquaticus]|uniref:Glycosyltransferase, catalytic subunit of cellulose synthase and poly-beta-1,6-N-acetylglucosamine synthase n=1 Tax=Blastococcus haudaquaticus TaxID=1938745 RepID=A0A286GXI3_9ACTN|nr:glycosyltransferase [Blastococcus haudaquaticus]SOE00191.1 Glycosyltransferase, catalytic subunit of cellulose synthase and poly-beta-1,6-N-acetylglucosamine synthase [Blastococcus haudaquaticus]